MVVAQVRRPLQNALSGAYWVIVLAAQMVIWGALINHNLTRAEKEVEHLEYEVKDQLVIGADTFEYREYFHDYPKTPSAATQTNVLTEDYKRPLYGPVSSALTMLLHGAFGIDYPRSMLVILSFYAALCTTLFYYLMRLLALPVSEALFMAGLATFSFGWLAIFSVPESYSLAICGALASMIVGTVLLRSPRMSFKVAALLHAGVTGVASWLFLPICGAVFLLVPRLRSWKEWLTVMAPAIVIASFVAMVPHFWRGEAEINQMVAYGDRWGSLANLASLQRWVNVISAMLFFSVVAPVKDFVLGTSNLDWNYVLGSWTRVLSLAVMSVGYVVGIWVVISRGLVLAVSGAAIWLASLMAFHVYFNPEEILLYLALPSTVLLFGFAVALAAAERNQAGQLARRRSLLPWLAGLGLAWVLAVNLSAVVGIAN